MSFFIFIVIKGETVWLKSSKLELPFLLSECPTSCGVVALKTGRREVPCSNPDHAYRNSRSELSVVFSETSVNTDWDPLERPPLRAHPLQAQVPQVDNWP